MAQHDYNIANASFPTVRTDINNVLSAVNSSNSGTSRPSSAVAGTIWLDTSGAATAQLLKMYDGAADILLGTVNFTANTIDWSDSSVTVADNSITLAKLASGTDGNLISYDASGDPVAVATGSSGQVLTSAGTGAVPSFQTLTGNATHSGEVTGATALTIADNVVDEANLKVSNSAVNGYMLTAQSGNTGGLTWAAAGGGKIAQVISTNNTTTGTFGSTTFGDMTGQTVNITPSASSSKILIFNHISLSVNNNHYVQFKLLRDSTSIGAGSNDGNRIGCITSIEGTGTDHMRTVAFQVLDSPNTTNQITYKAQLRTHDSNTIAFNRSLNDANQGYAPRASSDITVMEILA